MSESDHRAARVWSIVVGVRAQAKSSMTYQQIESPVGPLLIAGDSAGLAILWFQSKARPVTLDPSWTADRGSLDGVRKELDAYFDGRLRRFRTRLNFGGTPFQHQVWT